MKNYAEIATQWARDVVEGHIPSCKWTILSAKRHLRDLDRAGTASFPYRFDAALAHRACAFVEHLPNVKGPVSGEPIVLAPFQVYIVASLFGWINDRGDKKGKRRFRQSYIELPRSSGKSTLSSAIGLYMLTADGEGGAECYCLDPATKVLCDDFQWRSVGSLAIGDPIIAFDEHPASPRTYRKLRTATIESNDRIVRPCYRITFEDGRTVIASAEHRWLGQTGLNNKRPSWMETSALKAGSCIRDLGQPWESDDSRDGGYLAGAFDGEGFIHRMRHCNDGSPAKGDGFRPERLLRNAKAWFEGRTPNRSRNSFAVVKFVEFVGDREVVAIGTSTKTLFAEGLFSHNSAATTRDQAKIVSGDAQAMARAPMSKPMMRELGVEVFAKSIIVERTNSKFESLSADADSLEGKNVHFGCVDETHVHPNRKVWEAMLLGAGKRSQSLVSGISTAGFNLAGIGYELHNALTKNLENVAPNEIQFGCIWSLDPGDDWQDPTSWYKANPALGITQDFDYFAGIARGAIDNPAQQPGFKTKYLNMWLSNMNQWADMPSWERCRQHTQAEGLTIEDFRGEPCYMGCDLGAKTDIAAKVLLFERNGKHYLFPTYYLPEQAITDGRNSQYKGWAIEQRIKTTEGNILDYAAIENDIMQDLSDFDVQDIGIDPWEATALTQRLISNGATVTEVMQTVSHLSEPTKTLDAWTRGDLVRFDCPILLWMASNVVVRVDTNDNIKPNKQTPADKIDGVIAAILAIARYLVHQTETSVYEEEGRGILLFG